MKLLTLGVVLALAACGNNDRSKDKPMDPPKLSAAGDVTVPPGHETTYNFDGKPTKLLYTWIEILNFNGKPSIRIHAQGAPAIGSFSMAAHIPDGTGTLEQLAGTTVGAVEVSFGNAPDMATGTGATIKIEEVTKELVAGTFEAQACPFGERTCSRPMNVTSGKFRAFRSALADDAAFARYVK